MLGQSLAAVPSIVVSPQLLYASGFWGTPCSSVCLRFAPVSSSYSVSMLVAVGSESTLSGPLRLVAGFADVTLVVPLVGWAWCSSCPEVGSAAGIILVFKISLELKRH